MKPLEYQFYNYKRINDPVHGTIGLSELEVHVMNTKAFQRLRNVKQLGLVNFVFPGADFTRLSHSLGVCHVTGKMFETLKRNEVLKINNEEIRDFRLAALLHDIGHYPFSHTMEDALDKIYERNTEEFTSQLLITKNTSTTEEPKPSEEKSAMSNERYFEHDSVGREILRIDKDIKELFENNDIDTTKICSLFASTKEDAPIRFANIISSELDADRLDYLRRSSYSVGLPYGSVDINYLISQISIDDNNPQNLCINSKALRTVDHFLLSRYFEYSQVIHHKTIAAFELVLADLISYLVENKKIIDCSIDGVKSAIKDGTWNNFDDICVYNKIRELYLDKSAPIIISEKARSIIERKAPKEVIKFEFLGRRIEDERRKFSEQKKQIRDLKPILAKEFGIPEDYWMDWENYGFGLTKLGSETSAAKKTDDPRKEKQTVLIKNERTEKCSKVMDCDNSLMNILSSYCLYTCRLYLLIPHTIDDPEDQIRLKNRIREFVNKQVPIEKIK